MSIDEIMALADEYVSASIEDHGYRSGAASAEYLEDTKRKLLAALESLIAAPAAPQQAEPVEIVPRVWRETLRKLTFMARTSGGTPGPDEGLQTACAEAETLLSKPYNYPPAAPQQAEPVAWMAFGGSIVHAVTRNAMDPIEAERFDVPLYLHPPAAEVQQAEPVGDFQRSAPGKIWMNLGNDGMDEIEYPTWDALVRADENITWSEDRIDATDIPYVRADLAHPPAAEVQRLRDALTAICAVADDREEGNYDTVPIHFIRSIARDATKGGK